MKWTGRILSTALILNMLNMGLVCAAVYNDVGPSHWAWASIDRMAEKGMIVGNLSGDYKPDKPIDKFDTSLILAMAAGYKYSGYSQEEQNYYEKAYAKNKPLLNRYHSQFSKWNKTADKEIAFLLEKEILTESDLEQFIVIQDEKETIRALSRQEAAAFLVRLMGKKQEALAGTYVYSFSDDAVIAEKNKPYVYYLKNAGVVNSGEANLFQPNQAVTKASMAVFLDKTLALMALEGDKSGVVTPVVNPGVVTVETITGTIGKVHPTLYAIQVNEPGGEQKIHKIEENATIYVDGFIKTIGDLRENMPVIATIQNGNLVELKADSAIKEAVEDTTVAPPVAYDSIQGRVVQIKTADENSPLISVELKTVTLSGGVETVVNDYILDPDCTIKRGNATTTFDTITPSDVITISVLENKAYAIELAQKHREISGSVIDRQIDEEGLEQFYVVLDNLNQEHQFFVTERSVLNRNEEELVSFNDIKIGDTITVNAEFSTIVEADAVGAHAEKEGFIKEIHITQDGAVVLIRGEHNRETSYRIREEVMDVYDLRVGSLVRLTLDSNEIKKVVVVQQAPVIRFTGYIDRVNQKEIVLRAPDTSVGSGSFVVSYDENTAIMDYAKGEKIPANSLSMNMKVYVILEDGASGYAKSIAVLSY